MLPQCENASVRSISREADLAWLAGIVDGEGNLQATVQEKPCGDTTHKYFCPKMRITNTDVRMIKRVAEIYIRENIVFFYALNSVSRYKNKKDTWRNQLEITISSQGSVKKALGLILPYLVNKQKYAETMMRLIEFVKDRPLRGRMSKPGANYTEHPEFLSMIDELAAERAFFIDPSTTKRRAGELLSW